MSVYNGSAQHSTKPIAATTVARRHASFEHHHITENVPVVQTNHCTQPHLINDATEFRIIPEPLFRNTDHHLPAILQPHCGKESVAMISETMDVRNTE